MNKLEKLISIRIIQEDVETIYSLIKSERNPIFAMEILPYYALFIQSCQEFLGGNYISESAAPRIKDIRNHIKAYGDSFSKTKKRVSTVDIEQNEQFRSKLRFDFLKDWNIHLNLGTYWTADRHIVGNTQMLADFLDVDNIFDSVSRNKQYELGVEIGSFISSVRAGLSETITPPTINRSATSIAIEYYYDLNTNKKNDLFANGSTKMLNLFFLHLLCNMNFVKYVLSTLFDEGNAWAFRVEYIVTYYTFRALQRLHNYCQNNSDVLIDSKAIEEILEFGSQMFQSKFRNCMMHYNLENQGVLLQEHVEQPFFGIVETCFEGMDYYVYSNKLRVLGDRIIAYLEQRFNFEGIKLQRL